MAKPGLFMVIDPRPQRAAAGLADMLGAFEGPKVRGVGTFHGDQWAAAVIPPPGGASGSGAGMVEFEGDRLIWTGDPIAPAHWADGQDQAPRLLLAHLRQDGIGALAEMDGAFCGAWFKTTQNQWIVFNDRLGLLPVFWARKGERIVVAPKAHLAWQTSGLPLEWDGDAIVDVLRTANSIGDQTLIRGVRWLLPGSVLRLPRAGEPTDAWRGETYWEYGCSTPCDLSYDDALAEGEGILNRTVERFTSGDGPLRMGISGGMDSRLILAAAHRSGARPSCYTIGWPFTEDARFGRQLARRAGADHELFVPNDRFLPDRLSDLIVECDGLHSARHLGLVTLLPECFANHGGGVALEGYLFGMTGGSATIEDDDLPGTRPAHACRWATKHFHAGGPRETIDALLRPEIARPSLERWANTIDERYRRAPSDDPRRKAEHAIMNGRGGRIDVLGPNLMRGFVRVRSPGTARAFMDFMASLPANWRRGKRFYADLLRRRFPAFARVSRCGSSGLPISRNRLLREYGWQREKLYRGWARIRYPQVRRWGWGGELVTGWIFDVWQREDLAVITKPDARILNWVDGKRLGRSWAQAASDPAQAMVLLTLGTLETYMRWLERQKTPRTDGADLTRPRAVDDSRSAPEGEPLCACS